MAERFYQIFMRSCQRTAEKLQIKPRRFRIHFYVTSTYFSLHIFLLFGRLHAGNWQLVDCNIKEIVWQASILRCTTVATSTSEHTIFMSRINANKLLRSAVTIKVVAIFKLPIYFGFWIDGMEFGDGSNQFKFATYSIERPGLIVKV